MILGHMLLEVKRFNFGGRSHDGREGIFPMIADRYTGVVTAAEREQEHNPKQPTEGVQGVSHEIQLIQALRDMRVDTIRLIGSSAQKVGNSLFVS